MQRDGYSLELASDDDLHALAEHWSREVLDNGEDGVWFSPYDPTEESRPPSPERVDHFRRALNKRTDETLWQRSWVLRERSTAHCIVGSISLYGGRLPSELHRCNLGMGIEREHRGRKLGPWMVETALAWARAEPILAWVDLGVFETNPRARALYDRFGFVQTGRRVDAFRVRDARITDVSMSLAVK
jgi:RimJ/RimL family protein N-acetyltransferase